MKTPLSVKVVYSISFFCLLMSDESLGQDLYRYSKLRTEILKADSVFILSHDDTGGFIENTDGSAGPAPPLVLKGKLNRTVIHESLFLRGRESPRLADILTARVKEPSGGATCFMPHHSVVMVNNGNLLYIEICFGCHHVRSSEGLDFSDRDLDDKKWKKLKEFFKANNFKYELD